MGDADLDTVRIGVAGTGGAFGSGEGGRDGDVLEEFAGLLVLAEGDDFCAVDWGAATNGNQSVD